MKFFLFLLFFSIVVLTSCRTTKSYHRTHKKSVKPKSHAVKINGESISSSGVEIIKEESNPIVESNVDIIEYENTSSAEQIDDNYSEKQYNNITYWNSSSLENENKSEKTNKILSKNIKKEDVASQSVQTPVKKRPVKEKKELDENFAIAKSEMKETPFALVDDNRFSNTINDTDSKTSRILKQIKTLYLLGNNSEALVLLKNNWGVFSSSEKKGTSSEQYPLAEAFFLKGKINMDLAEKTADHDLAKEKYQIAIKSFYVVLSKYNARRCPFSSEAIKLFRKCRKKYFKLYQVKVGFPPEF